MEVTLRSTADSLRFRLMRIPHAIAVVAMALTFHTKDPYGVGYALNILFFTNLSPLVGSEAALLTWKWDVILGGSTVSVSVTDRKSVVG